MRGLFQIRGLIAGAVLLTLPAGLRADGIRFPVGEQARYRIQWGLFTCGTSTFRCDEVEWQGRTMIRVRVQAKSNWLVSTIYPVDDTVDCYIDPETGLSVRLEKHTIEGDKVCKDVLELDRDTQMASWISESDNISTNYPIEAGACDAVSFLYAFRKHDFQESPSQEFNVAVDTALHSITIDAGKRDTKKIDGLGKILCRQFTFTPKRDDLFVRKIPKAIWLSDDERRILVRMDLVVPVGRARVVLEEYTPPDAPASEESDIQAVTLN